MPKPINRHILFLIFLLMASLSALSAPLESPAGRILLTVSGKVSNTNTDGAAELDLTMLDSLPQFSITTSTPWYDAPRKFTGPLARDLVKLLGASGEQVKATALNDYSINIPLEDFEKFDVVLATRIDGKTISVREKGPIFVIYPFDDHTELVSETYYQRCIWQLDRLSFQ
ncbi:hypothetical protein BTA51_02815 [Hahella sp. CCB-MM4]|uniref:hypothetical protein n=1 Tax=Hahella sp. (strain CCB-MM4) TaxID=1926491 RepID=UPI000B9C6FBD|nr:hypothetical protein [Hahella sp. CCB-MM4]OZG75332.1 hypothetical protein BTA51_02815 [Hahella sp. CCB-MM4]